MNKENFLECGKIVNTHGIKGTVKAESWCDSLDILADLERVFIESPSGKLVEHKILKTSIFKQFVLMDLENILDIDAATLLKNKIIYASRDDIELESGENFIVDLIGLPIIDIDTGEKYGVLKDVINTGASDIYVIDTEKGEAMMPAVKEFVKKIELTKAIYVKPIEGMFEI